MRITSGSTRWRVNEWPAQFTAWNTVFTSWLCPSDGNNGGGRVSNGYASSDQMPRQLGPGPDQPSNGYIRPSIPVSNYAGSFGDNYCGGVLAGRGFPGKPRTMQPLPTGQPRIGWNGYWGTGSAEPADS